MTGEFEIHSTAQNWLAAVAVVLLGPALLLSPALRPGRVLSVEDGLLDAYLMEAAKPSGYERANRFQTDPYRQFIPWRLLTNRELLSGRIPFWNPYAYAGSPLLGNAQSGVFDPLTAPYLLTRDQPQKSTIWVALLRLWVAAVGALVMARRFGAGPAGAALAGLAYAGGGFTVTWLLYPVASSSAWLPWAFVAADRLVDRPGLARAAALAVALALSLFGGHVEVAFFSALAASGYVLTRGWQGAMGRGGGRAAIRWVAVAGLICVAVTAVQTLPFVDALQEGRILDSGSRDQRVAVWGGLHVERLVTQVFPYLWGRPLRGEVAYWTPGMNFHSVTGAYGSVLGVLLAVAALATAGYRSRRWALGAVGLLAWGYNVGVPPLAWVGTLVPIVRLAPAERIVHVALCAIAVLAGLGLESLLRRSDRQPWPRLMSRCLFAAAVAALALGSAMMVAGAPIAGLAAQLVDGSWGRSMFGAQTDGLLAGLRDAVPSYASSFLIPWGLIALSSALLLPRIRRGSEHLAWIAVAVVAIDLLYFGAGYNAAIPQELVFPEVAEVERVRVASVDGRALMVGGLPANAATFYRIHDVLGYDVLDRGRLGRLLAIGGPFRRFSSYSRLDSWVHDVLGVLVVTAPEPEAAGDLIAAGRVGGGYMYENPTALPLVFAPRTIRNVGRAEEAESLLREPEFDPRQTAVVEGSAETHAAVLRLPARLSRPDASSLRVELDATSAGLVVIGEGYDPGWRATIDGAPVEVFPAYLALMAVAVPAGDSLLQMTFRPRSWAWAIALTTLGIATVVALAARSRIRRWSAERI